MRRTLLLALVALIACGRTETKRTAQPFDAKRFVQKSLLTTRSAAELAFIATRKGRLTETRHLGGTAVRTMRPLSKDLERLASSRKIEVPANLDDTRIALRENLQILPGQVFDKGYTLAVLQDVRRMRSDFTRAAASGDAELSKFVSAHRAGLDEVEDEAKAVLKRLGGSPFGFE